MEDDALFCSECGTKQVPLEKICPNCGTIIKEGAKFCMSCGTPVNAAAAAKHAIRPQIQTSTEFEVSQPNANTLSFEIMGIPFNMKFIKGGIIGNTELSDFYIGETVVTQALWQMVMDDNPSEDNCNIQYPVTNITKQQVDTFLIRIKKITGVIFDIPTCSQFKYAALTGCENNSKEKFSETMWNDGKLHAVCGMMPSDLGLYDLSDLHQIVIDNSTDKDALYHFNPKFEEGDYSIYLDSIQTVSISPNIGNSILTLRLVINIPVSPEVEKAKKMKEDAAVEAFENSLRFNIVRDHKEGYMNKSGKIVIPCIYDSAFSFSEGLAKVKVDNKYGYIDKTGRQVIPCKYDDAKYFSEGLGCVKFDGKWGCINKTGLIVIPFKYNYMLKFQEGLALIKDGGKYGYIDKTGHTVIRCIYKDAFNFSDGLARIADVDDDDDDKIYGYIDKTGHQVIPCKYYLGDLNGDFHEGLAKKVIREDEEDSYGFIDKTGQIVIPYKYDYAGDFSEGLAKVKVNGRWGYINTVGEMIIKCLFENAGDFGEGLAYIKENGKYGFIDKTGKKVISCKYENANSFENGLANVKIKDKWGYVDKTGRELGFE